jgi:hypothetical protein
MTLRARCLGYYPDDAPCPYRNSCVRYTQAKGNLWLTPVIEDGQCYNRVTDLAVQMMGENEPTKIYQERI